MNYKKLNKKFSLTCFLLVFILSLFVTCPQFFCLSFAEETEPDVGAFVDFSTPQGYADWLEKATKYDTVSLITGEYTVHGMNQLVTNKFDSQNGYTSFFPITPLDAEGRDADGNLPVTKNGDFRMTAEIEFPVSEYPFIAFCYRAEKGTHISTNQIYARDDTAAGGEFNGTPGYWTMHGIKGTGEWRIRTIDISKMLPAVKGNFKSIRIPIVSRVGEVFDIKWIAAFKSQEDAEAFDFEEYKESYYEAMATEIPTEIPTETPSETPKTTEKGAENEGTGHEKGCGSSVVGTMGSVLLLCFMVIICLAFRKKINEYH